MLHVVASWFSANALRVAGWLAIAASVMAVLFGARQTGKNAVRVDMLKKAVEVKDAQLRAAVNAPRNRDELVKRLRDGEF